MQDAPTPVSMPEVLEPDRHIAPQPDASADDHREHAETLHAALEHTTEYGQALWQQLTAVRQYLADHLPTDRNDDEAWTTWRTLYGSVTSSLAGRTGDNGFGAQEAQVIEQHARAD